MSQNYVFVVDAKRQPLMPCTPGRARELLTKQRAAVLRRTPFTIVLKDRVGGGIQPLDVKLDPGSKTTGLALVIHGKNGSRVIYALHLHHRGNAIQKALLQRRSYRSNRRARHTRYRARRFLNRTRRDGWLPPSVQSRVDHIVTWVKRLQRFTPLNMVFTEHVQFDLQRLKHPETRHVTPGTSDTFGMEMRSYLRMAHNYTCQYCHGASGDKRLTWDHIVPRSRHGSDSLDNATLACYTCNQSKSNLSIEAWIASLTTSNAHHTAIRQYAPKVRAQRRTLRDAAAVNSSNNALFKSLSTFVPIVRTPSWVTHMNRTSLRAPKEHWVDAACVDTPPSCPIDPTLKPLNAHAVGHVSRRMVRTDSYGFPSTRPKGSSTLRGVRTGDIVTYTLMSGRRQGVTDTSRVTSLVHTTRSLRVTYGGMSIDIPSSSPITVCSRTDGYRYTH